MAHGGFKIGQPVYVPMPGIPHGIIVGFPTGKEFEEPCASVRFMTRGAEGISFPIMSDKATWVLLSALRVCKIPAQQPMAKIDAALAEGGEAEEPGRAEGE